MVMRREAEAKGVGPNNLKTVLKNASSLFVSIIRLHGTLGAKTAGSAGSFGITGQSNITSAGRIQCNVCLNLFVHTQFKCPGGACISRNQSCQLANFSKPAIM